ncbi:MAG: hypothetical protein IMZ44_18395 [Planctomycetes bacterium]|nr:hypothetical protein [Planctomycetota bacterium]
MRLFQACVFGLVALAFALIGSWASAEAPVPPVAAPLPAAPPPAAAAPPAAPAAPVVKPPATGKEPVVILAAPPPMTDVMGGKIDFAEKAFPIVVEASASGVQNALRVTKTAPCQACRGLGRVGKSGTCKPPAGTYGRSVTKTWEEDCPACGGYKDTYDQRFGQHLVDLVDRLAHAPRDEAFAGLHKSVADCLAQVLVVREKTLISFRVKPIVETKIRIGGGMLGGVEAKPVHTLTGADVEKDQERPFRFEAAPMVEPIWLRLGRLPPGGQAAVVIGKAGERAEASGWVCIRLEPAKGSAAIIICPSQEAGALPGGRMVLGGLMIGRWSPGGSAATPAGAPAATTPPAKAGAPAFGPLPPGSLPVVLAIVASGG